MTVPNKSLCPAPDPPGKSAHWHDTKDGNTKDWNCCQCWIESRLFRDGQGTWAIKMPWDFTVFMTAAYDHDAYGNAAKHLHFGNSVSYLGQRLAVTICHACLIHVREEFKISELCEFWNVQTPLWMGLLQTIDEKHCFSFLLPFFFLLHL